jgi:hypothetical protein
MKLLRRFLSNALIGGVLVVLPVYLAVLFLLKAAQSAANLVGPSPLASGGSPPRSLVLLLVLAVCF